MTDPPRQSSRRQFLTTASAAGLASVASLGSLAGCTGRDGGDGTADGASESGDGGTGATATADSQTAAGSAADLTVETLAVGGSPGEPLPVKPAGEVALLDFFATWCAPCKPQMDELGTVREQFPDLHMLSLTNELELEPEKIADFWREYDGTWPVAKDTGLQASQKYGVDRIPTLIVLDAEGGEVWRHSGLAAAADIVDAIEEARP